MTEGTQRPLRVGVLGCANIAWRKMLPAMTASPDVAVVAIASRGRERAEQFTARFGGDPVVGYQKLLERDDVEAVYVPLPAGMHGEWALAALAAGKHVLLEKPAVLTRDEAERIVRLATERGLLVQESFMFVHHGQHAAVAKAVADGEIGEVRAFTAEFGIPPLPAGDIRTIPELGGGALNDVGVYPIRAARLFLGDDLTVVGAVLHHDEELGIDVAGSALLRTPGGVTAQLGFGMAHGYRAMYALWGSAGRLELHRTFTPPDSWQPVLRLERQDHVQQRTLPADQQFPNIVAAFVRSVRSGDDSATHGRSLLRQAELLDAVRAAAGRA
ncbi:Gfo/Idh/MocA family protein [Micromonospora auratinigra]|uniref:Predicted dehydrogenase n=1 Tax=Micromonospora auratinigra TaxID=261654 RepID=A0A1A8ZGH8_9ACTN|nr:Gfo/Idh/MocA family oxidoreductase [Micromonospora auratinigra]SBT42927.1 Predicted dehydrogenase [Micromonospora auratinigra]